MSGRVQSKLCCWLEPPPCCFPNTARVDATLPINFLFYVLYIFIMKESRETSVLGWSGLFICSPGVAIMSGTHTVKNWDLLPFFFNEKYQVFKASC